MTLKDDKADSTIISKTVFIEGGLTKRELFAAMAMQRILQTVDERMLHMNVRNIALNSVIMADALLKELEKKDGV